jgi:cytochrome c-type biogenesis protein CcmH/NrfG
VLKSYSHDAVSAARLLAAHNFDAEAEQTYRLGMQLCPQNPEPVAGLADVLARNARENEGRQLLEQFLQAYPDQLKALEQTSALWRLIVSSQPEKQ